MEWLPELSEFLRIKSISADPAHGDDVKRAGEWVCARVREAGGECELVDWHGQPLAIGEIKRRDYASRHLDFKPFLTVSGAATNTLRDHTRRPEFAAWISGCDERGACPGPHANARS